MGNIPTFFSEEQVKAALSAHELKPLKVVLRHRAQGQDSFGIAYFKSEEEAQTALQTKVVFFDHRILLRPGGNVSACS